MPITNSLNSDRADEYTLNDSEFKFICNLVYNHCGIVLDERKREMVYRRLMRRTRDLKLTSFSSYCELLKSETENELTDFINAITTNLTSFYRESHHFDYLRDTHIPEVIGRYQKNSSTASRHLRIWSSACSTGEEPYSIAITLIAAMGSKLSHWDAKILATDLDSEVLKSAKNGIYKLDRIEDLTKSIKEKWFKRGSGKNQNMVKVNPKLQNLITFKQLNLLESWPMKGQFDVIFCRNVLIYFDKETQEKLIPRYYDLLKPGGILFLGHSENMPKSIQTFDFLGKTTFKKPYHDYQ